VTTIRTKLVSVESGTDWYDASYELIELPADTNEKEVKAAYAEAGYYKGTKMFLREWILKNVAGARLANYEAWDGN